MRGLSRRRLAGKVAAFLGVAGWVALSLTVAVAGAKEPLRITRFSMEPVQATTVGKVGNEWLVENKPYASPFTQAGGHPWGLRTVIEFAHEPTGLEGDQPTKEVRDVVVDLPPGLIGDPMAVPRCSLTAAFAVGECPAATQVGVYRVKWLGNKEKLGPIADVTPERGQSAEFALLNEAHISAGITGHLVRTPEGYGLTVASNGIPVVQLYSVETVFWGVPADPSHDPLRGLQCAKVALVDDFTCESSTGGQESGVAPVPFLSMGSDCAAGPQVATVRADSWEEPGRIVEQRYEGYTPAQTTMPAVTGCDHLTFGPGIEVRPTTELADEPVGLDVNLEVPQSEEPARTATPPLRNAVVTLPEGVSLSPSAVEGIRACEARGPEGIDIEGPESEEVGPSGELQLAPGHCPDASIVGTAEAVTPLLSVPVRGHVFLARPGCGGPGQPCTERDVVDGNLYKLYLELGGTGELAVTGVHVKLAGKTEVNPATGQLTSVFEGNPQTPFSELKIHLNEGPKAPLDNPASCGPARTTTDFTPWSAPGVTSEGLFVAGTPDATPSSYFNVGGCSTPQPFNPGFSAGTVTPQAARFSAFTMTLSRRDREQFVKGLEIHTPPGLIGKLSSVPLCGEPEADAGTCPASSRIGTTRIATGAGSHPFEIEGEVFLTGPYRGAPFGLSVVVHVVAGPFNLGDVVVRARISVDQSDSTLIVKTDESGPHAIPQIVFGVPARVQRITVDVDRPGFMFNPTNCEHHTLSAVVTGSENATAAVTSPFAVGGCRSLGFKPRFTVSTNGHTSRAKGASLDTKLSYPTGSFGRSANIAEVKVSLPRQLPSRLATLQKACPAAVFERDASSCPPASIVGIVRAHTPVLPVELSGPVYFVSHGGEAFPSLIVVLEGDGVRVDLTGTTFISKRGITSSTFKALPDVPVESFELYLPQGIHSALAANGNLCQAAKRLTMPTTFRAQNGLVVHRSTRIEVTGCGKRGGHATARRHRRRAGK